MPYGPIDLDRKPASLIDWCVDTTASSAQFVQNLLAPLFRGRFLMGKSIICLIQFVFIFDAILSRL